ncbi:MAG: MFS transporter [Nocardioides sp.]
MRAAFRQPGFTRLFAATTTSMFGDSVMLLVLSMWVKELTGSNAQAGLTFFWMVLPSLVAPLLGGPIDRVRRRPLLVWGNVASAAMMLPLLTVRDGNDVWVVWAVAVLYGVSFIVLPAGLNGLLKELLPEDLLVDANASMQTVKEGFRLIGPLVGAGIYAPSAAGRWRWWTQPPSRWQPSSSPRSDSTRPRPSRRRSTGCPRCWPACGTCCATRCCAR